MGSVIGQGGIAAYPPHTLQARPAVDPQARPILAFRWGRTTRNTFCRWEAVLDAARMLGVMLAGMEKNVGGRPTETREGASLVSSPTLSDLGISRKQSSRWQTASRVEDGVYRGWIDKTRVAGKELSLSVVDTRDSPNSTPGAIQVVACVR